MSEPEQPSFFVGVTDDGRFNLSGIFRGHDIHPKVDIENISLDQVEALGRSLIEWSTWRRNK